MYKSNSAPTMVSITNAALPAPPGCCSAARISFIPVFIFFQCLAKNPFAPSCILNFFVPGFFTAVACMLAIAACCETRGCTTS
jgi:hypothetical protein